MCIAELAGVWAGIYLADLLRYLVLAAGVFLIVWVWFAQRLARRKIQTPTPPTRQLWREFAYSMSTVVIFSLNGFGVYMLARTGVVEVYADPAKYGWTYWGFSIAAIIVAHDAYFYWTHRLMHHRRLFRWFHAVHHKSRTPSPWAAYAFAPPEAVASAVFLPIFLLLVPMNGPAIGVFVMHMLARNVIGHCGYELFPRATLRLPGMRRLTTVTHHDLHHSSVNYNFGLYFTWWDRLMGTEHPDYRRTFGGATGQAPVVQAVASKA